MKIYQTLNHRVFAKYLAVPEEASTDGIEEKKYKKALKEASKLKSWFNPDPLKFIELQNSGRELVEEKLILHSAWLILLRILRVLKMHSIIQKLTRKWNGAMQFRKNSKKWKGKIQEVGDSQRTKLYQKQVDF